MAIAAATGGRLNGEGLPAGGPSLLCEPAEESARKIKRVGALIELEWKERFSRRA